MFGKSTTISRSTKKNIVDNTPRQSTIVGSLSNSMWEKARGPIGNSTLPISDDSF